MEHIFQSIEVVYIPILLFVGAASVVPTESGEKVQGSLGTLGGKVAARERLQATNSLPKMQIMSPNGFHLQSGGGGREGSWAT